MRVIRFLIAVAALTIAAHRADAQPSAAQPDPIGGAWPAPVGHAQPRAVDSPIGILLSPSQAEQERRDRELDAKLQICRGC